jgi:cytidyltransferase-like protein
MVIATSELGGLAGSVTMVDGGFDPIHPGHVAYFRAAAALGAPVLCNVSSDEWVERKHPPLLVQSERGEVIDALRWISYTHLSQTTTAAVLETLRPRYYAKGADWRGRLPEDEQRVCALHGVELVFLDTVTSSSTSILERYEQARDGS